MVRIDHTATDARAKKDQEDLGLFQYDFDSTFAPDDLYRPVQFPGKSNPKMESTPYQTARYTAFIFLDTPC